jgi:hypothetical protein
LRKRAGELVLHCDGSLKGLAIPHTQGLSKNAQLQATVNYSCLWSLHFVMLITNAKPCQNSFVEPLWYGEQPNAIARPLNLCFIFI